MRYTVSTVLIAAASAIAAGCQSGSTRLQMAGDLKEVGLACHNYKTVYERWPAKLADLAKVISKDDYARVSDGRITFVENLSAPQPDVIVAYETGAPDKGGATAETTNGSLVVAVPSDLQAEIEAKCLNGNFYSELPITMESTQRPREMRGKLGGGGAPIHLHTVNGGIRLIVLRSSV